MTVRGALTPVTCPQRMCDAHGTLVSVTRPQRECDDSTVTLP